MRENDETIDVSTRQLDRVSDRLGQLYQDVGRLRPDRKADDPAWDRVLDEIVNPTAYVERLSGRKKRLFASRAPDEGERT